MDKDETVVASPASEETIEVNDDSTETSTEPSGEPDVAEVAKKAAHLENLTKAIAEAQDELKRLRGEKKEVATSSAPAAPASEVDLGKREVRQFALQKFLESKPALAQSPERLKELMEYYERVRTATETTQEGVLLDLNKAYAVVYHEDILRQDRAQRVAQAQAAIAEVSPAIDSGSTGYQVQTPKTERKVSAEESQILAAWGMTPAQWQELHKKHSGQ